MRKVGPSALKINLITGLTLLSLVTLMVSVAYWEVSGGQFTNLPIISATPKPQWIVSPDLATQKVEQLLSNYLLAIRMQNSVAMNESAEGAALAYGLYQIEDAGGQGKAIDSHPSSIDQVQVAVEKSIEYPIRAILEAHFLLGATSNPGQMGNGWFLGVATLVATNSSWTLDYLVPVQASLRPIIPVGKDGYLLGRLEGIDPLIPDTYANYLTQYSNKNQAPDGSLILEGTYTSDLGSFYSNLIQQRALSHWQFTLQYSSGTGMELLTDQKAPVRLVIFSVAGQTQNQTLDRSCFWQGPDRSIWGGLVLPGRWRGIAYTEQIQVLAVRSIATDQVAVIGAHVEETAASTTPCPH